MKDGSSERGGELFLSEYGSEVVWVDDGVVTVPLFWVDVPTASKCVGFGSELTGAEADNHVELGEVLGPSGLPTSQHLRGREILEVLVIGDNVYWRFSAFEIVSPEFESLEDSQ